MSLQYKAGDLTSIYAPLNKERGIFHGLCLLRRRPGRSMTACVQSCPPLPPHLTAVLKGKRDSRRAHELKETLWQHFQPFLAGRGYQIAWNGDNQNTPNMRVAANPFSPRPNELFTAATAGRVGVKWGGPRAVRDSWGGAPRSC